MKPDQWIERCAARLGAQWPTIDRDTLAEVAEEIRREHERELEEPEHAAAAWLSRGLPHLRDARTGSQAAR